MRKFIFRLLASTFRHLKDVLESWLKRIPRVNFVFMVVEQVECGFFFLNSICEFDGIVPVIVGAHAFIMLPSVINVIVRGARKYLRIPLTDFYGLGRAFSAVAGVPWPDGEVLHPLRSSAS